MGGGLKNEYFFGYEHFVDILWIFFLCILGSFLKVNIQNQDIVWGCKNFKYFFWGASNFWYFFGVNGRCWVRAYVCRKN